MAARGKLDWGGKMCKPQHIRNGKGVLITDIDWQISNLLLIRKLCGIRTSFILIDIWFTCSSLRDSGELHHSLCHEHSLSWKCSFCQRRECSRNLCPADSSTWDICCSVHNKRDSWHKLQETLVFRWHDCISIMLPIVLMSHQMGEHLCWCLLLTPYGLSHLQKSKARWTRRFQSEERAVRCSWLLLFTIIAASVWFSYFLEKRNTKSTKTRVRPGIDTRVPTVCMSCDWMWKIQKKCMKAWVKLWGWAGKNNEMF